MIEVIALDLEGTLISNAVSQIPRPGLYEFLEGCKSITDRVVIFTAVKEDRFRRIAELLVSENMAPAWFMSIEYVKWEGATKNLSFIPRTSIESCILVDDFQGYVHAGQESQWIEIKQFEYPYPENDGELQIVLSHLGEFKHNYPIQ